MIAQDWSIAYSQAGAGTTATIGGSSTDTNALLEPFVKDERYESCYFAASFLVKAATYSAFETAVQALRDAIARAPRGRLLVKLGSTTELDWNPDLTAGSSELAMDAEPTLTVSGAPPNSGYARRIRFAVRFKRPSTLAGQNGRSINASAGLEYATQDRKIVVCHGYWTATPGSPGKDARASYQDGTNGVDVYARAWIAANAGSANDWALKNDSIEPTDTLSVLKYRREYWEVIGGRHEALVKIRQSPSERRMVTVTGTYLATQTGGAKSALTNYNNGATGAAAFSLAQCNAIDNTATWKKQWCVPSYEEKSEQLTFVAVYLEQFTPQSFIGKDDPLIAQDRVTYLIQKAQSGFSPNVFGPGMGLARAGGDASGGAGGGSDGGVRQITYTGGGTDGASVAANTLAGTSAVGGRVAGGAGANSGDASVQPLFDVVIKVKADIRASVLAGTGLTIHDYFEANLLDFYIGQASSELGKTILLVENFQCDADLDNSLLLATIHCKADSGAQVVYASLTTTILRDPGRIFRKVIGGQADQYVIQPGPTSAIKLRRVGATVKAAGGPSPGAFVLGDHPDPAGGTWYVLGAPSVGESTLRDGLPGYTFDLNFYAIQQVFIYVASTVGNDTGGGGSGGTSSSGGGGTTFTNVSQGSLSTPESVIQDIAGPNLNGGVSP